MVLRAIHQKVGSGDAPGGRDVPFREPDETPGRAPRRNEGGTPLAVRRRRRGRDPVPSSRQGARTEASAGTRARIRVQEVSFAKVSNPSGTPLPSLPQHLSAGGLSRAQAFRPRDDAETTVMEKDEEVKDNFGIRKNY